MSFSFRGRSFGGAPSLPLPTLRPANLAPSPRRFWQINRLLARPVVLFAALLVAALAARACQFGNPVVQVDDQFYLLVGDRMTQGALPYVDIWDRKPVGLFLIYAGIRLLGGDAVLTYQLVATVFAAATAFAIARLARLTTTALGGALAGVLYLVALDLCGGDGGQAPVFYNLFVVLAVGAAWKAIDAGDPCRILAPRPFVSMVLMGVAMQVKYTAMFEGMFLGLALLWHAHLRGASRSGLAARSLLWIAVALTPTIAAWGWYAAIGHGELFYQANFESIFWRRPEDLAVLAVRLMKMLLPLVPLVLIAWLGWKSARRSSDAPRRRRAAALFGGWALAAMAGLLVFGSYFDHYALPLLAPLALCAAPVMAGPGIVLAVQAPGASLRVPPALVLIAMVAAMAQPLIDRNRAARGWGPQFDALAEQIRPRLSGCLYVFDGDVGLYRAVPSCIPTRWAFPNHLNLWREDGAIGTDALAEVRRIMAGRPHLVVAGTEPDNGYNPRTRAFMDRVLARDYVPVYTSLGPGRQYRLYERSAGR